jgi:hypothetical protein
MGAAPDGRTYPPSARQVMVLHALMRLEYVKPTSLMGLSSRPWMMKISDSRKERALAAGPARALGTG